MKSFFQYTQTKVTSPPILSEITKNEDGDLIATLLDSKHESEMKKYLDRLKIEFRRGDHIINSFTYEYNPDSLSFKIKPINVTIQKILAEFAMNNLLVPRENDKDCSARA